MIFHMFMNLEMYPSYLRYPSLDSDRSSSSSQEFDQFNEDTVPGSTDSTSPIYAPTQDSSQVSPGNISKNPIIEDRGVAYSIKFNDLETIIGKDNHVVFNVDKINERFGNIYRNSRMPTIEELQQSQNVPPAMKSHINAIISALYSYEERMRTNENIRNTENTRNIRDTRESLSSKPISMIYMHEFGRNFDRFDRFRYDDKREERKRKIYEISQSVRMLTLMFTMIIFIVLVLIVICLHPRNLGMDEMNRANNLSGRNNRNNRSKNRDDLGMVGMYYI